MAELVYFTARLYLKSVVADGVDVDTDPDTKGIHGGVTFTPIIAKQITPTYQQESSQPILKAATLTTPALIVLAPIRAKIDDGRLKLRADSEGGEDDQPDVRLVAQTAVLGLTGTQTLVYDIAFDHVTFNGRDQSLPGFRFAAPTTDSVLDLTTAARIGD